MQHSVSHTGFPQPHFSSFSPTNISTFNQEIQVSLVLFNRLSDSVLDPETSGTCILVVLCFSTRFWVIKCFSTNQRQLLDDQKCSTILSLITSYFLSIKQLIHNLNFVCLTTAGTGFTFNIMIIIK